MSKKDSNNGSPESAIRSGPEIVAAFIAGLKTDPTLDGQTVSVIDALNGDDRLTVTNLLRYLEEARGKTNV
jgi:hypothetical protein